MLSLITLNAALAAPTAVVADADWKIKKLSFSAVSIGVAMKDHKVGWSSFTTGAGGMKITKTIDGGKTFNPVNVSSKVPPALIMGVGATQSAPLDVVTTGMAATTFSTDGDNFTGSHYGPFVSQSIRTYDGGRVAIGTDDGIYLSSNGGKTYKAFSAKSVLKTGGRYVSAPTADVIYLTAGMW